MIQRHYEAIGKQDRDRPRFPPADPVRGSLGVRHYTTL